MSDEIYLLSINYVSTVYFFTQWYSLFCIKSSLFKRKEKEVESSTGSNHVSAQKTKV